MRKLSFVHEGCLVSNLVTLVLSSRGESLRTRLDQWHYGSDGSITRSLTVWKRFYLVSLPWVRQRAVLRCNITWVSSGQTLLSIGRHWDSWRLLLSQGNTFSPGLQDVVLFSRCPFLFKYRKISILHVETISVHFNKDKYIPVCMMYL